MAAKSPACSPAKSPACSPSRSPSFFRAPAVAFVGVARTIDGAVLAKLSDKAATPNELRDVDTAAAQLLQRAGKLPAYPGWRDRLPVGDDLEGAPISVYALADSKALCVAVAAIRGARFPERLAYGLLQEVLERTSAAEPEERLSEAKAGELTASLKGKLKELTKSYNDPAKADKVTEVHEKVDAVKGLMQENVKKILETHVSLEVLQTKSDSMSTSADQFLKRSVTLRREVQLRNIKVKVVTAAAASALALYLLLPVLNQ